MNTQEHDWLAGILLNPDKNFQNFKDVGWNESNTTVHTRDYYKSKESVLTNPTFLDDKGKFDEGKFNRFYDQAQRTYYNFITLEKEDDTLRNFFVNEYDFTSSPKAIRMSPKLNVETFANPLKLKSVGVNNVLGEAFSVREIGQKHKIWDFENNVWLDETPNDSASLFAPLKTLFSLTKVLATWDSDGTHADLNGRQVQHKKGEYKIADDGSYYYETLGNRNANEKQVLSGWDIITVDGSTWNKIDIFDSDGFEKSIPATVLLSAVKIAPYLFKKTRNPWALINVVSTTSDLFAELAKPISSMSNGSTPSWIQEWAATNNKIGFSQSDAASQSMFTFETMAKLGTDVFDLLVGQRYIAESVSKIPKFLKWGKAEAAAMKAVNAEHGAEYLAKYGTTLQEAIKTGTVAAEYSQLLAIQKAMDSYAHIAKAGQWGAKLSQMYMAVTQAQGVMESFAEAGFGDAAQLGGFLAASTIYGAIFALTPLGEIALKGLSLDEIGAQTRNLFKGSIKEMGQMFNKVVVQDGPAMMKTSQKVISKFGPKWAKRINDFVTNSNTLLGNSLAEAFEEVSEEVIQDGITLVAEQLQKVFGTGFGKNGEKVDWNWWEDTNPIQRYIMSAVGGAVGGAMLPLVDKQGFKHMKSLRTAMGPELMQHIYQGISAGHLNSYIAAIDKQVEQHKTGFSGSLSTELKYDAETGTTYFESTSDFKKSQEYLAGEHLKGMLTGIESLIAAESLNLKPKDVAAKALMMDALTQELASKGIEKVIYSDFSYNMSNLIDAFIQKNTVENVNESQKANELYNQSRRNIDDLLSGKRASEYVERMMFSLSPNINNPFFNSSLETYALGKGINLSTLTPENYSKVAQDYLKYKADNAGNIGSGIISNQTEAVAFTAYKLLLDAIKPDLQILSVSTDETIGGQPTNLYIENYMKAIQDLRAKYEPLSDSDIDVILSKVRTPEQTDEAIVKTLGIEESSDEEKALKIREHLLGQPEIQKAIKDKNLESRLHVQNWLKSLNWKSGDNSLGLNELVLLKNKELLFELLNSLEALKGTSSELFVDTETKLALQNLINSVQKIDFNRELLLHFSKEVLTKFINDNLGKFTFSLEASKANLDSGFYGIITEEDIKFTNVSEITYWKVIEAADNLFSVVLVNRNGEEIYEIVDPTGEGEFEYFNEKPITEVFTIDDIYDATVAKLPKKLNITSLLNLDDYNVDELSPADDLLMNEITDILKVKYRSNHTLVLLAETLIKNSFVNPIYSALLKSSERLFGQSLESILGREEELFKNARSALDLSDIKRESLDKVLKFLPVFNSLIQSREISKEFNYNDLINYYLSKQGLDPQQIAKENPTISKNMTLLATQELQPLQRKLAFLLWIDEINKANRAKELKKFQVRLNTIMIKMLTGNTGNPLLDFMSKVLIDGQRVFNFPDINENIDTYYKNGTYSDNAIAETEALLSEIKHSFYQVFSNLSQEARKEVIRLMMDNINFDYRGIQGLSADSDLTNISPVTLFNATIAYLSYDDVKFKSRTLDFIGDKIPFSTLLFNAEIASAFVINRENFLIVKNILEEDPKKYFKTTLNVEDFENLSNFIGALGDPGTGKTEFLANMIVRQALDHDPNLKIWAAAPTQERANRLGEVTKLDHRFDRLELFKNLLSPQGYEKFLKLYQYLQANLRESADNIDAILKNGLTLDGVKYLDNFYRINSNLFSIDDINSRDSLPQVIMMDEYSQFSRYEIQILDNLGITVVGLGDRKLLSATLFGVSNSLDGIYFALPEMTASIRAEYLQKKDNQTILSGLLGLIANALETSQHALADKIIQENLPSIVLSYQEVMDDDLIILKGEKLVSSISEEYVLKLLKSGLTLALITESKNDLTTMIRKLSNLPEYRNKITIASMNNVLGREFDYVIMDYNPTPILDTNIAIKTSTTFTNLKETYTGITRSRKGTLIVKQDNLLLKDSNFQISPSFAEFSLDRNLDNYSKLILNIYQVIVDNLSKSEYKGTTDLEIPEPKVNVEPEPIKPSISKKVKTPKVNVDPELGFDPFGYDRENTYHNLLRNAGVLPKLPEIPGLSDGYRPSPWNKPAKTSKTSLSDKDKPAKTSKTSLSDKDKPAKTSKTSLSDKDIPVQTYYKPYGLKPLGNGKFEKSGYNSDLGNFTIESIEEFKNLEVGLAYLREFVNLKFNNNLISPNQFNLHQQNYKSFTDKYFDGKISEFYKSLAKGLAKLKIVNTNNDFFTKGSTNDVETKGVIVYQINTSLGLYDITLGSIPDAITQLLLQNSPKLGVDQVVYFNYNISKLNKGKFQSKTTNKPISLAQFRKYHPEFNISQALIETNQNKQKTDRKGAYPFVVFDTNLFNKQSVNEKNNMELLDKAEGILWLDRTGYTPQQWMDKALKIFSNVDNVGNTEKFTGLNTTPRIIISMIEYLNKYDNPLNTDIQQMKKWVDLNLNSSLLKNQFVRFSKTGQSNYDLYRYLSNPENLAKINRYITSSENKFNELQYLSSANKIFNVIKTYTQLFPKGIRVEDFNLILNLIEQSLGDKSNPLGTDLTVGDINAYKQSISTLLSMLSMYKLNEKLKFINSAVLDLINGGVLITLTNSKDLLRKIVNTYHNGSEIISAPAFQDIFNKALSREESKYYPYGIEVEAETYNLYDGSTVYVEKQSEDEFTVNVNVMSPSLFMNPDGIDLNTKLLLNLKNQQDSNQETNKPTKRIKKGSDIVEKSIKQLKQAFPNLPLTSKSTVTGTINSINLELGSIKNVYRKVNGKNTVLASIKLDNKGNIVAKNNLMSLLLLDDSFRSIIDDVEIIDNQFAWNNNNYKIEIQADGMIDILPVKTDKLTNEYLQTWINDNLVDISYPQEYQNLQTLMNNKYSGNIEAFINDFLNTEDTSKLINNLITESIKGSKLSPDELAFIREEMSAVLEGIQDFNC